MMRIAFFLSLLFLLCAQAQAADKLDHASFAQIPVQHEGRIKPLDSFSRAFLKLFSGKDTIDSLNADQWLAETLFDPAQSLQRPLFRVFRPDALGLPAREKKYYSYAELTAALQQKSGVIVQLLEKDEKNWSTDQRELMRLHEASILYAQLLRSFTFTLPLNIEPPEGLMDLPRAGTLTLEQYSRHAQKIENRVKDIVRRKGDDPGSYTEKEKAIVSFAFDMQTLRQAGENNVLLRIVPGQGGAKAEWFSPWALMQAGQGSPDSAAYLDLWQAMAKAYLSGDAKSWDAASAKTLEAAQAFSDPGKIRLEVLYNIFHPPGLTLFLYFLTFTGFILYSLRGGNRTRLACLSLLGAGSLVLTAAIISRVLILERPPVGTLYESILFVAAICSIVSFFLESKRKDGTGILLGSLSGLFLLFAAESFAEDDTMKMLVAVLNTNLWLATHVLCITIGYGWCLITALLAHVWLARSALGKDTGDLVSSVKSLALVALLFTAVGTILGGIWADQSWGRFWGWDPKENGALLIVLWLVWLLHAQISGHLKRLFYMAGMAMLSIIVALAWFGVNLLSVGLHSYGFITGVAAGLGAFCAAEIVIVGFLCYRIRQVQHVA